MAVQVIASRLNRISISEGSWTVISGAEEPVHENGNYESTATSTGTSPTASFMGSSTSSFSSISGSEMSLPKSTVKKRRVGPNALESYGLVTFEDDASEEAVTDDETDISAKLENEDPFTDFEEFDGDDESSEEESDDDSDEQSDSDGESDEDEYDGESMVYLGGIYNTSLNSTRPLLTSFLEYDEEPCANVSFISFTESVSFNMTVSYVEPPTFDDSDDEDDPEETMTFHEQMIRALAQGKAATSLKEGLAALGTPEEHGHDILDVDKRLLAAYVNGIHTASESYKKDLASLALNINEGLTTSPFLASDFVDGCYLNSALKHVIGIFRNLVAADELECLLDDAVHKDNTFKKPLGDENCPPQSTTEKSSLHQDISLLLSERLIDETMPVEQDVLDFFTRGIIYSLKEWASEGL
jgi:hypothetical protein